MSSIYSIHGMELDDESSIDSITRQACTTNCPVTFTCPVIPPTPTDCASFACINAVNATIDILTTACQTVNGNLTVGDSVDIKSDLLVENNLTVFGDGCLQGDLQVGENVTIGGNEVLEGSLTVINGAIINGPLTVNGNETINGNLNVTGSETINQNITIGGTGTFNGLFQALGGLAVFGGQTINSGGLVILSGGASINGDVTINGNQTVDDLDILGNLTVEELASFNGCSTTINGPLIVNGPTVMNRGLTIASGNQTIMSGDLTINVGNLTVGGSSTFNGPVVATNGATINNGLTVFGGQTIATGDFVIATCGNATIGGSLTVNDTITSPSPATLLSLLLTGTTNSTSPTTGTLVVNGGVGIGQDLWLGGSEFFANVSTEGGTPSPLNYYEETCFPMQFQFDGGTPTTVLVQAVRIGNLVNLLIPTILLDRGAGFGLVMSTTPLPERFRPCCTVRGASSTIVGPLPSDLGVFEIRPDGTIIFGIPGPSIGPFPFLAAFQPVIVDINTITYNLLCCACTA